jgi:S1-C subfamily serine protease
MPRALTLAAGLLVLVAPPARADDSIAPETVAAIKAATVYVRVEGDGWGGSGSGFVVAADKERLLVVTNHHVAVKLPPGARPKPSVVSVVFGSGTAAEREYPATVVASDEERDLAVLRVAGVKDAPKPIAYTEPPKPVETMGVFSFGFPLGQALAVRKGFPAVTVGKASVSSLREGEDGELAVIQIDGNLNPGNSGGPVIDVKGRLVGVAVARARDGQGIGFLIPAAEVGRLMAGRVGRVRVVSGKGADGKPNARIEAELIDPAGVFRAATAYYVVVPPKGKSPDAAALDKHPDARKLALKVEKGVAAGEIAVEKAEGGVVVQVVLDRGDGATALATRTRAYSLAPGAKPEDLAGPPPAGWKEYTPPDKAFTVWLPEKPAKQAAERRAITLAGEALRGNGVAGKTDDGLVYRAETIDLPPAVARLGFDLHEAVRRTLRAETKGLITEATATEIGTLYGVDYRLESGSEVTRVRAYVSAKRIYVVRVVGTASQVATAEAETILVSFRRPGDVVVKAPDRKDPAPAEPKDVVIGKDIVIVAGGGAPRYKDVSPDAGVLIGLEIGLGKFFDQDVIKAVRPIYRVGKEEKFGEQRGTHLDRVTTLKAKDGYAVGAMTYKCGLNFDGCSLTFMKVVDGKLDPKDSYESQWVGWNGDKQPAKIESGGRLVVGIVGRATATDATGLGLLFKGQEGPDPAAPAPMAVAGKEPKLVGVEKEPFILGSIAHDPKFKTVGPEGAILIGLEARFGKFGNLDIVRGVRPIYRVNAKEEFGKQFGDNLTGSVTMKAKEGYAVGGITGKAGPWCNGFSLTYMKVKPDGTLDPKDSYQGEWAGFNGESEVIRVMSDGAPVVGIVGKIVGSETTALGLLYKGQEGFDPNAVPGAEPKVVGVEKEPHILGSIARDPKFKTVGPEGAILIGLEARFAKFGGTEIVRAVRPIYRVNGKEEFGKQFGDNLTGSVTLKAKEGYAVGGITGKAGLWCNGFSLTYMKVKPDGTLDPKDSYESEWVGFNGKSEVTKVVGDGTPVVGIVGKIVRTQTTALGLLYKGQEGFDPEAGKR